MEQDEEYNSEDSYSLQMLQEVIKYIEKHLLEEIYLKDIATQFYINSSSLNLLFKLATGMTIMEYVRNRRLTLAGQELMNSKNSILDIALKYRYETPEAFTKAFSRIYGFPPSMIRRTYPKLKQFLPMKLTIRVSGGWTAPENVVKLTKAVDCEQDSNHNSGYNEAIPNKGGFEMKQSEDSYSIQTKDMRQKEDWNILLKLAGKLKEADITFKVDGKTMIFAHGLEFPIDKIHLTFLRKEERKVMDFFGEKEKAKETFPGFRYFDTSFEGKKIRCMFYGKEEDPDTEESLYMNADEVFVDGNLLHVQSLEFYYENANPDEVYYKMVEEYLHK